MKSSLGLKGSIIIFESHEQRLFISGKQINEQKQQFFIKPKKAIAKNVQTLKNYHSISKTG
jgi:hypothetical protein